MWGKVLFNRKKIQMKNAIKIVSYMYNIILSNKKLALTQISKTFIARFVNIIKLNDDIIVLVGSRYCWTFDIDLKQNLYPQIFLQFETCFAVEFDIITIQMEKQTPWLCNCHM